MQVICEFAIATGMRQAEICRLDIADLDRSNRTIIIRDRKDPKQKEGNNQTVPLLPAAWAIVAPMIQDRTEGYLFPFNQQSVSVAFTRACQNIDPPIIDLHFHDLRHKATASFFRMGLDIPKVALLTPAPDCPPAKRTGCTKSCLMRASAWAFWSLASMAKVHVP